MTNFDVTDPSLSNVPYLTRDNGCPLQQLNHFRRSQPNERIDFVKVDRETERLCVRPSVRMHNQLKVKLRP